MNQTEREMERLQHPDAMTFSEFYESKLSRIFADHQVDYALQRLGHALRKPLYYLEFQGHHLRTSLAVQWHKTPVLPQGEHQ